MACPPGGAAGSFFAEDLPCPYPEFAPCGEQWTALGQVPIGGCEISRKGFMDNIFIRVGIAFFTAVTVLTLLVTLYSSWL